MFITEDIIAGVEKQFGVPHRAEFRIPVSDEEFDRIRASQKHDRKHDITLYIFKDNQVIVIAKPFYPPGLYRAPSGGVKPGEDFVEGALREAFEETGCKINLEKFVLRAEVSFCRNARMDDVIEWSSFVFKARYVSGDFQFTDTHEISECRLADLDEFNKFSAIMRSSDIGGLHYRAALHDTVKTLL